MTDQQTDEQMDGRTDGRTKRSVESRACMHATKKPDGQTNSALQKNRQTTDNLPFSFFMLDIIISALVIDPSMNY